MSLIDGIIPSITQKNLIIFIKVFDKKRKQEYFIEIKNHDRQKNSVFKHAINPPINLLYVQEVSDTWKVLFP
ncbi:hypothetical protein CJF42_26155 [Pseudoalteromonas sp. NBT06-2]|nr:hypothetical protein CJF42_26155 [Pseudoalteromonas sp. NBT06-2]